MTRTKSPILSFFHALLLAQLATVRVWHGGAGLDGSVARWRRLADRDRPEERGPRGEVVRRAAGGGQADQGAVDHPGRVSRLSRRGLVLARVRRAGQSARRRPLSAAVLGGRLPGRGLAQRHARRRARGRRDAVRARRDRRDPRRARRTCSPSACSIPTHEPIDGIVLNETPTQARVIPYSAGAAYNHGGITDSVELLAVPAGAGRGSVRARRCRRRA